MSSENDAIAANKRAVVVRIPGDICAHLAKNRQKGRHWALNHRHNQDYIGRTRLIWRQLGEPAFAGRVRLSFLVFRGRPLDEDGAGWAMSSVVDGLKGEAFRDDDAATMELGGVRFVCGKAWAGANAVTEVRIEAIDG